MIDTATSWSAQDGVLKRRGYSNGVVGFYEFAPGSVMPIGVNDVGTRNVGPRIANLTVHTGDIVMTPSTHIVGLDIYGTVTGRGGTMTDCIIRGHDSPSTQDSMAKGQSYDFGGAVFSWCRFDGTGRESTWNDCMNGGNYTAKYCEFTRGVDGIGANTVGNATIECCRISNGHYDSWWSDAAGAVRSSTYTDFGGNVHNPPFISQASGDTHSDGIQIQGWSGWVVRGCYIGGVRGSSTPNVQLDPTVSADYSAIQSLDAGTDFAYSALMINAIAVRPVGALIEKNWLQGGNARINMSTAGSDKLQGLTIKDNKFIRSSWGGGGGYYIYAYVGHQATLSNNVFSDDGTAVPVVTH